MTKRIFVKVLRMNKRNCLLRFYCVCLWLKQARKQKGKYCCSHWLSINVEQDGAECCGTGTRGLLLKVFTRIWTISLRLGLEFTEAPVLMSTLTGGLSRFSWSSNIETFTHNLVKSFSRFFNDYLEKLLQLACLILRKMSPNSWNYY